MMMKKILLILLLALPVKAQYFGNEPIKGSAQLNKNHPAVRNLVGCWLMNEGGGDTSFDLSGYKNHGTFQNDTSWTAGKFGSCLEFDSSANDYVVCGDSDVLLLTGSFTIVAWAYTTTVSGWHTIIEIGSNAVNRYGMWINNDRLYCTTDNTYTSSYKAGIVANTWQHLAVVFDAAADTKSYYIDGVDKGDTSSETDDPSPNAGCQIGHSPVFAAGQYHWDGKISSIIIFDRVLSAAEIQSLYRDPFQSFIKHRSELIANAGAAAPAGNPQVISIIISGLCVLGIPIVFIIGDRKAA